MSHAAGSGAPAGQESRHTMRWAFPEVRVDRRLPDGVVMVRDGRGRQFFQVANGHAREVFGIAFSRTLRRPVTRNVG